MWEGINWKDIFPIRDKTLSPEEASTGKEREHLVLIHECIMIATQKCVKLTGNRLAFYILIHSP